MTQKDEIWILLDKLDEYATSLPYDDCSLPVYDERCINEMVKIVEEWLEERTTDGNT
jgi:hypothetical protein